MKKYILIPILTFYVTILIGQTTQYTSGGYGYFFTGPSYLNINEINNHLKQDEVLGAKMEYNNVAMMFGGEGFGMNGRFLIGGGGIGYY